MSLDVSAYRPIFFISFLATFTLLGILLPRRSIKKRLYGWIGNLSLGLFNGFLLSSLFTLLMSKYLSQFSFGLFYQFSLSSTLQLVLTVVLLDFFIYLQHLVSHRFRPLWILHRVHHTDTEFDASSALRFHTLEIFLSFIFKGLIIVTFGFQFEHVVVFEIILNSSAIFNHSNTHLGAADSFLRKIFVTPDFHRVHHSIEPKFHHSNFGFFLSIWDQIFRTAQSPQKVDHPKMRIGLDIYRSDRNLWSLLTQPFRKN